MMKILKINTENRRIGNIGEDAAAKYLKKNRYKIRERNYSAIGYEIDIIAEKKDVISFIEVKARTISDTPIASRPAAAVTPDKMRKIISLAKLYIGMNNIKKRINLDVIEVYLRDTDNGKEVSKINHIIMAYDLNRALNTH